MLEVLDQTLYAITHFYLNTIASQHHNYQFFRVYLIVLLYRYLSFLHCRLSFLQSTLSFFTFEQFIFPAIYIRVLYLFFNISTLYLLHFIFLHSHHLHHHNIHLVTQHQDRLVSRSVLKSLHPRQREPCGRDRSFLGPQSTDQKSGERIYIHIRTKPRMAPRPRVGTPSHTSPSQEDTCSPKKPSAH